MKQLILRGAGVELLAAAAPGKLPRIAIVANNGQIMDIAGWGPVVIDLAGLKIGAKTPILADHNSAIGSVIGHGTATVKGGKLLVDGVVSGATEAAAQVVSMAASGFEFQASIGTSVTQSRTVKPGEKVNVNGRVVSSNRGFELVTAGQLREVTVTPLGADDGTSVAIAAMRRKEMNMDDNNSASGASASTIDRGSIITAERERVKQIRAACSGLNREPAELRSKIEALEARAIDGEIDLPTLQAGILNEMRASRAVLARDHRSAPEGFSKGEFLQAALLCRQGLEKVAEKTLGAEVVERASSLRSTHSVDLMRAALRLEGREIPHGRDDMIRAAFSTNALAVALGETANKVVLASYMEAPQDWRIYCDPKSVPDFKTAKAVRPSFGGTLDVVAPSGELKHTTLTEFTSDHQINTFGKRLTVSRQDVINDNIGVFTETAAAFGSMAMRSLNDAIYSAILANANNFFSTGNGNYAAGADTALGIDSLAVAMTKMRVQRDAFNNDLDIMPAALVVPPALETQAKSVLQSEFINQTSAGMPTGNVNRGALKLIVEPRLNNTAKFPSTASAKHWYVFGAPRSSPVLVAFLNGQQSPTVEFFGLQHDVNTLAMSWRVFMDYGAALCDPKAAVRMKGEV